LGPASSPEPCPSRGSQDLELESPGGDRLVGFIRLTAPAETSHRTAEASGMLTRRHPGFCPCRRPCSSPAAAAAAAAAAPAAATAAAAEPTAALLPVLLRLPLLPLPPPPPPPLSLSNPGPRWQVLMPEHPTDPANQRGSAAQRRPTGPTLRTVLLCRADVQSDMHSVLALRMQPMDPCRSMIQALNTSRASDESALLSKLRVSLCAVLERAQDQQSSAF
jgi:hypothetical protein